MGIFDLYESYSQGIKQMNQGKLAFVNQGGSILNGISDKVFGVFNGILGTAENAVNNISGGVGNALNGIGKGAEGLGSGIGGLLNSPILLIGIAGLALILLKK